MKGMIALLLLFFLLGFFANMLFKAAMKMMPSHRKEKLANRSPLPEAAPGGMAGNIASKVEEPIKVVSVTLESTEKGLKELPTKTSKKDKKK
jgi:hypothetical protein